VPEDVRLKTAILEGLGRRFGAEALIASNTSSISIDELSTVVEHPERFLGMHFFNPVPASRLVEVVRGLATSDDVVGRAVRLVDALLKQPVVVSDSPGFASSRLGVLLGLEAIRMLEEGVASARDIDLAMELGYGHRMGPLRSTDLVGLDVRLGIAEYLEQELGPRFAPPALLREMTEQGRLGRKSGSGFFEWEK
jgi:3-hydroxybutyryl-CoA dehydrogenase